MGQEIGLTFGLYLVLIVLMPTPRKIIPKGELKKLYFDDKKSMEEIGRMYGCNHVTITNRFKEFGWKSRGNLGLRKSIKLSEAGLKYLYFNRLMPLDKIGKMLGCSKGAIERRVFKYELQTRGTANRVHFKYKKNNFDGDRVVKAYMIGFRIGDLNIVPRKQVITVRCSTTHKAQTKLISSLFKKYGGVSVAVAKRGTEEINIFVNRTFDFLLPKWKRIPSWIMLTGKPFWAFVAGYVDVKRKGLQVASQDEGIIWDIHRGMNRHGVVNNPPTLARKAGHTDMRGVRNNKNYWRISLYRKKEIQKFIDRYLRYGMHSEKVEAAAILQKRLLQ